MLPASYIDAHRYDGAAIERQPPTARAVRRPAGDIRVIRDVRRHKFLTAPQLRELWWPQRSIQATDRRLLKLFRAGYLERFRPLARRGSFPWTYHLGAEGHRLLQHAGIIGPRERFTPRAVYDYGHVLHELQLNAWVLATRRALGPALLTWEGETHIEPPPKARQAQLRLHDNWSAEDLRDPRARPLRPDAMLEILGDSKESKPRLFLVEYDRTRRVDKNYDKFRRYDTFRCWWWRHAPLVNSDQLPFVLFICQDENQRGQFLSAADHELTGHRWHPSGPTRATRPRRAATHPLRHRARRPRRRARGLATPRLPTRPPRTPPRATASGASTTPQQDPRRSPHRVRPVASDKPER